MRLVLENRLLFDGAVVAQAAEVMDDKSQMAEAKPGTEKSGVAALPETENTPAAATDFIATHFDAQPEATLAAARGGADAPALLVVDSRYEGLRDLVKNPPVNTQIKIVDGSKNGYQQISNFLKERGNTGLLQLQPAEVNGKLWLGTGSLEAPLSAAAKNDIAGWGDYLDGGAHILVHSREAVGNVWLDHIAALSGSQSGWSRDDAHPYTPAATPEWVACENLTPARTPVSLVFVDTTVENYQILLQDIDLNATVILLDGKQDEVSQIAQAAAGYGQIDAIHIISHGSEGQLRLGSSVLDQASMQGKYADELGQISQHLSADADILVYGCEFGKGEAGLKAVNLLSSLTGADVAASNDATGSAKLGGDWVMERSAGVVNKAPVLSAAGMAAFAGLLEDPVPSVTLSGASAVSIGGQFTFTATFDNTASTTGTGYAPYIDLVLPATGKDGAGAAVDDGITFVSATYLGQAVTATTLTFDAAGHATHPYAKDNTGAALVINGTPGDQLVVLTLPFGSVTAAQPAIPVLITAALSNLADVAANTSADLQITAKGGFRFGKDALDNPSTDPSIVGAAANFTVHPTVVTMTQTFDGPEQDTATGPNYIRHLTNTATPATGQTLANFDVTQTLPNTVYVKGITPDAGGTVTSITLNNGTVLTSPAAITAALADGEFLQSYTVRYATLNATKNTVVDFYIPENDATGAPILSASTGEDRAIAIAAATGSGSWTAADGRDGVTTVNVSSNNGTPINFDAKAIAVQKSVAIPTGGNTGALGTTPGDTLEYTLKVDISDFFAFGRNNANTAGSWLVNDVLGDGQTWDNGFTPTLVYTDATGPHTVTLVRGTHFTVGNAAGDNSGAKAGDGKTYLQFDMGAILTRLQGDLHGDAVLNGASGVTIKLRSTVDDTYTSVYVQPELNEGDRIDNNVSTDGTLLDNSLALTGQNEADTSSASSTIAVNQVVTSIVGVNGNLGTPTTLKPGDNVTIRVRYDLATGDYENFKLKSFLPLPVLLVNDSNADGTAGDAWTAGGNWNGTGGNMPTVGQWKYGNSHSAGNVVAVNPVTADGTANSLTFDFGSNSNPSNNSTTAEVLFTIKVDDAVFADKLFLTLLAQSLQNDTVTSSSLNSEALVNIELAEPQVAIKTGVVKVSNAGASITGTTGTWEAAGTGGSSVPFSGTIATASAVDGNLTNFDGGDTIRLATALENTGGSAAFDVTTTIGAPPAGLSFVGGSLSAANLKVARGDGTLLTLGTDYSVSGNIITFLDNGGVATLGVGRNGSTPVNDGSNVIVITYDVAAAGTVDASHNFTTSANLTNYASIDGGTDFTPVDLTDIATETSAAPSVAKVFRGGTATNDDSSSPSTTGANLVVGESMLYDIKITLPEGNTQNLRLDDLVPAGMKLDTSFNGTGYELITSSAASGGSLGSDFNGSVSVSSLTATPSGTLGNPGVDGRVTFSATSTANADNVAANNTFVVRVQLIADNALANQNNTTISTPAQLVYSDIDGNGGGAAVDRTVPNTGGTPQVTIREPQLTIAKTVSPSTPVDEGDTVTYTIVITNPLANNINAYDLIYGDTFPSQLSSISLISAIKSGFGSVAGSFEIAGNTVQTLGGTAGNAGVNLDLAPGDTLTLTVSGTVNGSAAAITSFDSNSVVRWSSIDSADNLPASQDANERTGADGVGSGLNNYAAQDGEPVSVQSAPSLSHVGGLPDTTAPSPTTNPETVAIGEIVRYRAVVRIPEGSINNFNIQANLPGGLSYINDGSTKVGFIYDSASGSVSSSLGGGLITSGTLEITGNDSAPEAGNIPADLSNGPDAVLAGGQINTSNAQAPVFSLGDLTNNENDTGGEFVVIEFNARVDNTVANTTADSFNVNFTYRTGNTILGTSNTVVENVVEPSITNLTKTVTSFDPVVNPTTGRANMTLNFTNSGDGAAHNVSLTDSVTGGGNYVITSVTIGGTAYTVGTLPSGVTASATGGISVNFSQLAPGTAVSVVYTVEVPNNAAVASTDAVVTYSSLPETYTGTAGTSVGGDGSASGERDGSGGAAAPNNYRDSDGAGLGVISGTLWDDTNNANGVINSGETRLTGQTVTLVYAGANGVIGTGGDDQSFTTTTDSNGAYNFGALPPGNYRITGPNSGGTITVAGLGGMKPRFDTDGGTLGQVNRAVGEGASATANIGYVQQNDAPVNTVPGAQTVNEDDTNVPVSGLSIADPDAGTSTMTTQLSVLHGVLNVTLAGSATISAGTNGTNTLTISGSQADINATLATLTYSPAANYNGGDTLTVLTNDRGNTGDANNDGVPGQLADALTDTDTVSINVAPVNDAPVISNAGSTKTYTEDAPGVVLEPNLSLADVDDTNITTATIAIGAGFNPGDTLNFTPQTGISGSYNASTGVLTLTGTASRAAYETALRSVTFSTASQAPSTLPRAITWTVKDANADNASNGVQTSLPASTTVNIIPINDAPVNTVPGAQTVNEDGTLSFVSGTNGISIADLDAGTGIMTTQLSVLHGVLNVTLTGGATISAGTNGTNTLTLSGSQADINATLATLIYSPAANYNGSDTLTVLTNDKSNTGDADGDGVPSEPVQDELTDTDSVAITVNAANDNFADPDEVANTPEDTPLSGNVIGATTSVDGPVTVLSFTVNGVPGSFNAGQTATIPNAGTLVINQDGSYTFTPELDFNGPAPVATYILTDGSSTDSSTLTITVDPVDDPFADNNETATTPEGVTLTGDLLIGTSSVDGPVTISGFTINGVSGTFSVGSNVFIPDVGEITINSNGSYSFVPWLDFNGAVPVTTYTLTDGSSTDSSTLTITVDPMNDNFTDPDEVANTPEDTPLSGNVIGGTTSVDGPVTVLSFTVAGDPTVYTFGQTATIPNVGVLVINADGSYTFTPAPDFNGPVPVATYTLTDGSGTDETSTLTITVDPVSDIQPDSGTTPEDTPTTLDVLANDGFEPGTVITAINNQPIAEGQSIPVGNGSVKLEGGRLVFTPAPDFHGAVPTFTYTATNVFGDTETADVNITVTPVPDIQPDSGTTPEDTPITLDVLANDGFTDPGAVITHVNGQPITDGGPAVAVPNGGVQLVGGQLVFTPAPDFNGTVPAFTYTVLAGNMTETAHVNITVTPVNDPPVAKNDGTVPTFFDRPVKGNLLTNDSDPDRDPVTVTRFSIQGVLGVFAPGSLATIPGVGILSISPNGDYAFTPAPGYSGPVPPVTYTISDGEFSSTAVLEFGNVPGSSENIGAVIILANPTPSLFPPLPGAGGYLLAPLGEAGALRPLDTPYQFPRLSLYDNLPDCDLYLAGSLRNQVVLERQLYSFSIPPGTFRHTNGNEELQYEATKPDGSPLPEWLAFNPKKLDFTGTPPLDARNTDVVVVAKDHCGNRVYAQFRVLVTKERDYSGNWKGHKDKPVRRAEKVSQSDPGPSYPLGKSSFNEQVCSAGRLGRLMESRQLLNSLERL